MFLLIPRRGAREDDRKGHAGDGEPSKGAGKDWSGLRSSEEEKGGRDDSRCAKVADTVRKPGEQVENGVRVSRKDVGEVGAVEDVFERGKNFDPNVGTVLHGDESVFGG